LRQRVFWSNGILSGLYASQALAGGVESGESYSEDILKPEPEQATQRFEHYELVKDEDGKPVELGRGAMGVTYKAFDIDLHCPVALKVISERYLGDESARLRFLREARAAASVRHPNVASIFHLGRTGENYFYAMEFVEGETLEKLIICSGRLEVRLALKIATQVASGLAAVHKQKLVHRDIKPSNIMVSLEDGGAVTAKSSTLGWPSPHRTRLLKLRFQLPELLPVHRSSLVRSSSPELAWTSARTCTRWALCFGRW
jgi:serine/threonine protein kinase